MKYIPHDYQKYTIDRMHDQKKIFAVLDMGLGKTSCTLTAIERLMYDDFEVGKVLIIAPLFVADVTWEDERDKWDHLRRLRISKILGTEKQRIAGLNTDADLYTINRENVKWLVDYFVRSKKPWPFDMIVVDESSSFKSGSSQRFKALKKATPITSRVILLTGTPDPNGLMDLWSQVYLLDGGERLGKTLTAYRSRYFMPGRRNGNVIYDWIPREGAKEEIFAKLADIMISLTAKDYLKMPERIDNIIKLKMPEAARARYEQMEEDCILELEQGEIVAGNKAAVTNKLLQMANGAVYYEDIATDKDGVVTGIERKVERIHDVKLDALEEIVEDNAGQPIAVFYNFQHDFDRLMERFKKYNPTVIRSRADIERWNRGEARLLFAHPASVGHGLNLQAGGSIAVWFGVPNNLEWYQQANARLHRQGQRSSTVVISHLLMEGTQDIAVMRSLKGKSLSQDELIAAVKARIESRKTNKK